MSSPPVGDGQSSLASQRASAAVSGAYRAVVGWLPPSIQRNIPPELPLLDPSGPSSPGPDSDVDMGFGGHGRSGSRAGRAPQPGDPTTAHWIDESLTLGRCLGCARKLTLGVNLGRVGMGVGRHHCRHCGGVFCAACSDYALPLNEEGHMLPSSESFAQPGRRLHRACYDCSRKHHELLRSGGTGRGESGTDSPVTGSPSGLASPRSVGLIVEDAEDAEPPPVRKLTAAFKKSRKTYQDQLKLDAARALTRAERAAQHVVQHGGAFPPIPSLLSGPGPFPCSNCSTPLRLPAEHPHSRSAASSAASQLERASTSFLRFMSMSITGSGGGGGGGGGDNPSAEGAAAPNPGADPLPEAAVGECCWLCGAVSCGDAVEAAQEPGAASGEGNAPSGPRGAVLVRSRCHTVASISCLESATPQSGPGGIPLRPGAVLNEVFNEHGAPVPAPQRACLKMCTPCRDLIMIHVIGLRKAENLRARRIGADPATASAPAADSATRVELFVPSWDGRRSPEVSVYLRLRALRLQLERDSAIYNDMVNRLFGPDPVEKDPESEFASLPPAAQRARLYDRAQELRAKLAESYLRLDATAKKLREAPLETVSPTLAVVHANMIRATGLYVQENMIPMRSIPPSLRRMAGEPGDTAGPGAPGGGPGQAPAAAPVLGASTRRWVLLLPSDAPPAGAREMDTLPGVLTNGVDIFIRVPATLEGEALFEKREVFVQQILKVDGWLRERRAALSLSSGGGGGGGAGGPEGGDSPGGSGALTWERSEEEMSLLKAKLALVAEIARHHAQLRALALREVLADAPPGEAGSGGLSRLRTRSRRG
ncbi:hypothetical protein H696_04767 [Fonticula alba]|uniref:FYVE-type domain-containing protein n=1 Tax=Fonticula alba TaxID=691883 RepID=A0A058Z3L1_FONAL|nr:hypothetical protein H696_04767 [Fonticula alba]KCV68473.1 hypothetical protein H696_04767 [Fonticula alba]|eukprot:XP_009496905.1 hypothetical protein H696_04767 [Fonticula alba]